MRIYDESSERWVTLNRKNWSEEHGLDHPKESLVQQHFGPEQDINAIVKRFGINREMPFGAAQGAGLYGDFTGIEDYESALDRVRGADERFMRLPAEVREKFNNDPGQLLRFANTMDEPEFVSMFEEKPEVADPSPE